MFCVRLVAVTLFVVEVYDVPVPWVKPIGPTSMSNAAEEEDQLIVADVLEAEVSPKPIGSGHGGISLISTSSIHT